MMNVFVHILSFVLAYIARLLWVGQCLVSEELEMTYIGHIREVLL